jgi:hypothetical protein
MTQIQYFAVVTDGVYSVLVQAVFKMKVIERWSHPIECQITTPRWKTRLIKRNPTH